MKKLLFSLLVATLFAGAARAELFIDAVFAKLSCYTPYQMPIPWFYYEEDSSLWGEYSVYGVDVGLPWSESRDVYGLGAGIYLDYTGKTAGATFAIAGMAHELYGLQAGIYNHAEDFCGVQLGIVNRCDRAYGIQIGLVNVIQSGSVRWFPIANMQF